MKNLIVLIGLNLVIALTWCTTYVKWDRFGWSFPTHYLVGEESDMLSTLAGFKAVTEGDFLPFRAKLVKRLGAPEEANWNDYPIIEEIPLTVFGFFAKWFGLFAGLNLSLLLGHLLAGTSFFLVARYYSGSYLFSYLGALAYGLAPFLFSQSPHHITVQYVWHLPFFILIWKWVLEKTGIEMGSRKFWFAISVGLITGLQNIYYSYLFCQLLFIGALVQFLRNRSKPTLVSAFSILASVFFGFCLMNIDTWGFQWAKGPNPNVLVRDYKWLELYGLKIVDLLIPGSNHQIGVFAKWGQSYRAHSLLNDEGSYLGFLGLTSLFLLVSQALGQLKNKSKSSFPLEVWQILWIILFFTTGGFNAIQGTLGFTVFRTGCRYSIVILLLALLYGVKKISVWESEWVREKEPSKIRSWYICAAILGTLLVFLDQAPRSNSEEEDVRTELLVKSDREFTEAMEAALPKGAMVFQLPVMSFPESQVPGVDPYNHFRPYLYSQQLRFSFGSHKGRKMGNWQVSLLDKPLKEQVKEMIDKGFSGLYVNRMGYQDGGEELLSKMKSLGYGEPVVSKIKDLWFFKLNKKGS